MKDRQITEYQGKECNEGKLRQGKEMEFSRGIILPVVVRK